MRRIKSISVNAESVMTIENKTSFQRLRNGKFAMTYLGGFANRDQIEFLKKVISDNPNIKYYHFGDIDIGGFLIHKHLCRETSKSFEMYCMGIEQLCDVRFSHCLRELTDNDMNRIGTLMGEDLYNEVLKYMKENNVKLEQDFGQDKDLFKIYFMNYGENEEQVSDKYKKGRNILYVAITRAIKNLRVLYIDDFEEIKDGIKKVFEKAYQFTNEIAIEDF